MMLIEEAEVSRQISEELTHLMINGWHPLLVRFSSLRIQIDDVAEAVLSAEEGPDGSPSGPEREMPVLFQETMLGTVMVKERDIPFDPQSLASYADHAALLRLQQNPEFMLPPAQCLLDGNGQLLWQNGSLTELQRLADAPLPDLIRRGFAGQNSPREGVILAVELTIQQIPMLTIGFPIRAENGDWMQFVILSDSAQDPKSAVIKEIHHRVKNNLQTIASLLRLQMRRLNSKKVEKAFHESINRISSIALIHEELSRGGIDKINIKSATANLMEMVLSSMVPPGKNITGELYGADVYQDADKASSLSLCITELIQNSVEHAFPMRKKGVIQVVISEEDGDAVIIIRDNGIGFGGRKAKNSLGLEIIEMITVEKLKGTFTIEGDINGTTSVIRFPRMV